MDIIEFDTTKYRLGSLCKRGHDWSGVGQTLRYISSYGCVECSSILHKIRNPHQVRRKPFEQAFWDRVDKSTDCWEWQGRRDKFGYGRTGHSGLTALGEKKTTFCHRIAWELTYGKIPEGLKVLHIVCDNPPCCNVSHLRLGTQADNIADMEAKGRKVQVKGEQHWCSKLTEQQVKDIKQLFNAGGIKKNAIAKQFGVTKQVIGGILNGKGWKHVN